MSFLSSSGSACLGSSKRPLLQGVQRREKIASSKVHGHCKENGIHYLVSHISMAYKCAGQIPVFIKDGEVPWCVTCRARTWHQLVVCLFVSQPCSARVNSLQVKQGSLELTFHADEM